MNHTIRTTLNIRFFIEEKPQKIKFTKKKKKQSSSLTVDILIESTPNLFGFEQIHSDSSVDTTLIFEEINKELEGYLLEKSINTEATDGVFDFLETLTNRIQEEFEELIGEDSGKKRFIRALKRRLQITVETMLTKEID